MFNLRPNCGYCDKDLPPSFTGAMICTYQCAFCACCVDLFPQRLPQLRRLFREAAHLAVHGAAQGSGIAASSGIR